MIFNMSKIQSIELEIDTCGLVCPMPLLKTKTTLRALTQGSMVRVVSTDPAAQEDFITFSYLTNHKLLGMYCLSKRYYFIFSVG